MSSPVVPNFFESRSSAESWSSKISFFSYSNRPISVDLPSSTDPQVRSRRVGRVDAPGETSMGQFPAGTAAAILILRSDAKLRVSKDDPDDEDIWALPSVLRDAPP